MAADLCEGLFEAEHPGFHSTVQIGDHGTHDHSSAASSLHARTVTHLIDGKAHQFTWEPAPADAANATELGPSTLAASVHPLTSIPVLNSNPGAAASLYLDFNGHFQGSWGAWSNITTPVYDSDGDQATFSDSELANILAVWQRVAEDYLPFNINVTTVEPTTLAAGASETAANGKALRIAVGGTSEWMGASWGGYAYINSFTSSIANVAYVFAGGSNSVAWMGDVVSHEAGHAFGLQHQSEYDANGVKTSEYHPGTQTWIPLMGTSGAVGDKLSTWHNGTDSIGPTSLQDDIAEIARPTNVFGYRADDHSNAIGGATPLAGSGTEWVGSGFVGAGGDIDWFSLDLAQPENLRITATGPAGLRNLDVALELRDAAGVLIASASPGNAFDATLVRNLSGRHYIGVKSNGEYGRLGQYTVTATESLADVRVTAPATLVTSERGTSDTFSVVLTSRPTGNVIVPVASSNPTEGVVSPAALVFTPDDWHLPKTVTVTGMDDSQEDGVADYSIMFGPMSGDPDYELITVSPIAAANADDDTPGWAFSLDAGTGAVYANEMTVDAGGNLYLVGSFGETVDFDPGAGVHALTADYIQDGFIAKYSPTHELIWVRTIGGGTTGLTYPYAIDLDESGNAYVAGSNSAAAARFGAITLGTQGSNDAFLTKLDANGNFQWAVGWGGAGTDQAWDVDVDGNGAVHVAGLFADTVDFNPAAATLNRAASGLSDGFVSRFDSSGNFFSVAVMGGAEADVTRRVSTDAAGNAYVAGNFTGTAQFGGQSLTSAGGTDTFLAKINSSGNFAWTRQAAGASAASTLPFLDAASDGSVTFAAYFTEDVHFGPGTPTLTSAGDSDVFLTRYSSAGDLLQVGQLSGPERVRIHGLEIGSDGTPHVFGTMSGVVDLDAGPGVTSVAAQGPDTEFVLRLTPSYQFRDVTQMKRIGTGVARSFAVDSRGNMYASAQFNAGARPMPTGEVFENEAGIDSYFLKLTKAPGVAVSAPNPYTTESGASTSIAVVLEMPPTADVTIPIAASDATEGIVSPASLTFTPANWNVPQYVTVTGRNDAFADGDKAYAIILGAAVSVDPNYAGFDAANVQIVNRDDELQTITVANATSMTIPDRGTITSTINLAAPGTILDLDVRVNISHGWNEDLDVTLIAPDGTRIELFTDVGGSSANFTNTVLDDEATQSITAGAAPFTGRYRPEGNLTSLEGKTAAGAWRLEVKDDARLIAGTLVDWAITARTMSGLANPSAVVTPTTGLVTTEGGGTASFTIRLDAQPTANVTFPLSTSDATEGAATVGSVTFTPANWNLPQTVIVAGVDDALVDGPIAYTIVLGAAVSADPDFAGLNPADVAVANNDNDTPTTKFYVVDDASANRNYEYGATGSAIENYAIASANSAPRGVASTIAGDRVWVVDANRNVYVYNTSGGLLGSWTAGTMASNALPEDITVHGSDVWIVDRQSDRVYRYAGAATRLSGSAAATSSFALNSSNGSAMGLVTDGASIWIVDDSSTNRVFKYTLTGALLGSWTIASANATPTGITIDPANVSDIWIVDSGTDRVYQYVGAASRTSGSVSTAASFALASGNANPQGITDPPPGNATAAKDTSRTTGLTQGAIIAQPAERPVIATRQQQRRVRDRFFDSFAVPAVATPAAITQVTPRWLQSKSSDATGRLTDEEPGAWDEALALVSRWN